MGSVLTEHSFSKSKSRMFLTRHAVAGRAGAPVGEPLPVEQDQAGTGAQRTTATATALPVDGVQVWAVLAQVVRARGYVLDALAATYKPQEAASSKCRRNTG